MLNILIGTQCATSVGSYVRLVLLKEALPGAARFWSGFTTTTRAFHGTLYFLTFLPFFTCPSTHRKINFSLRVHPLEFWISKFSFPPCLSDLDIWPESTVLHSTDPLRLSHILHDSLDCFLPRTCSMNWSQIFFLIKLWRLEPGQGDERLKDWVGYHLKQDLCPPLTALVFLFVFGCCFHSCCFLQNLASQVPIFNCSFETQFLVSKKNGESMKPSAQI